VAGNPLYDTVSIAVMDDHTLIKRAKKGGKAVFESKLVVSTDGTTLTEWQTLFGTSPQPVEITRNSSRLSKRAPGSAPDFRSVAADRDGSD
jgi:hypothetical protein